MRKFGLLISAVAIGLAAACGAEGEPGGVTPEESRQLDEAAAMLDRDTEQAAPRDEEWPEPAPAEEASAEGE